MPTLGDNQIRVNVRWGVRSDMPAILWMDSGSFDEPWTEEDFAALLRKRNVVLKVAESDDRVIGYVLYELRDDSIGLLRLAVSPEFRRQRVGLQMIAKLIGKLRLQARHSLTVDVSDINLAAHLWLRALGFYGEVLRETDGTYRFTYRVTD